MEGFYSKVEGKMSSTRTLSPGQKNVETIAVYWEPKVKTYGFQASTGLSLVDIHVSPDQLVEWGEHFRALENASVGFVLVLIQQAVGEGFHLYLLMKGREYEHLLERCKTFLTEGQGGSIRIVSPVEMIHFQGPHFGDRYGIVDTAFNALNKAAITILAAACTGASVYLVLPEQKSEPAKSVLEETFEIPKMPVKRRGP